MKERFNQDQIDSMEKTIEEYEEYLDDLPEDEACVAYENLIKMYQNLEFMQASGSALGVVGSRRYDRKNSTGGRNNWDKFKRTK